MLRVEASRPLEATGEVAVDEYLPLSVTTSRKPLAVSYYTVGDDRTSLAEIKIERLSRLVREVVLVSFRGIVGPVKPLDVPVVEGVPLIAAPSVPEFRAHRNADLRVGRSSESLAVDWRDGRSVDLVIRHERLSFCVGNNELLGFLVTGLSALEVDLLRKHGRRSPG